MITIRARCRRFAMCSSPMPPSCDSMIPCRKPTRPVVPTTPRRLPPSRSDKPLDPFVCAGVAPSSTCRSRTLFGRQRRRSGRSRSLPSSTPLLRATNRPPAVFLAGGHSRNPMQISHGRWLLSTPRLHLLAPECPLPLLRPLQ